MPVDDDRDLPAGGKKHLPAASRRRILQLSDFWRMDGQLSRSAYVLWGSFLTSVKYYIDTEVSNAVFHRTWSLMNYFAPGATLDTLLASQTDQWFFLTMVLVSLPFIWLGVIMTMRRLRGAGLPVWLVMLFFVPVANLLMFSALCILPSRDEDTLPGLPEFEPVVEESPELKRFPSSNLPSVNMPSANVASGSPSSAASVPVSGNVAPAEPTTGGGIYLKEMIFASVVTVPVAGMLTWMGIFFLKSYGWGLFIGMPFAVGMVSAYLYCHRSPKGLMATLVAAWLATSLLGFAIILYAWEGAICLAMATPIGLAIATLGALLGWGIQRRRHDMMPAVQSIIAVLLMVPCVMGAEYASGAECPLLSVSSICTVDAPREKVWQNVIAFPKLPEPTDPLFKAGVAYPIGATINGAGVGAVRRCNFSTGTFIEPITTWHEPELLQFGVRTQPEPMKEFGFGRDIQPAHLDGYLNVHKGEFRLEELPGGKTKIIGTTWYDNRMWPAIYWRLWSDLVIHKIHNRVLDHIKSVSEKQS